MTQAVSGTKSFTILDQAEPRHLLSDSKRAYLALHRLWCQLNSLTLLPDGKAF